MMDQEKTQQTYNSVPDDDLLDEMLTHQISIPDFVITTTSQEGFSTGSVPTKKDVFANKVEPSGSETKSTNP